MTTPHSSHWLQPAFDDPVLDAPGPDTVIAADGTATQVAFAGQIIVHSKVTAGTPIYTLRGNSVTPEPAPAAGAEQAVPVSVSDAAKGAKVTDRVVEQKSSRPELTEASILEVYQPKQLDDDELAKLIDEASALITLTDQAADILTRDFGAGDVRVVPHPRIVQEPVAVEPGDRAAVFLKSVRSNVVADAQFYADIEGHPEDPAVARALDELRYFTSVLTILGVYPADPLRAEQGAGR